MFHQVCWAGGGFGGEMLLQMALFLLIANSSCLKLAHECKHDTAGGRTQDVTLSFPGPGSCVLAVSGPAGAHQGRPCLVQGEARPFQDCPPFCREAAISLLTRLPRLFLHVTDSSFPLWLFAF